MRNNRLLTIFLVVFVDLLGFSLILPLLPYYAEQYGANDVVVGLLAASYAAAQFLGAPLLGRLSDQHGRRPILLVSIAGTIAGFILLALAEPLGTAIGGALIAVNTAVLLLLFISRIIDGLTGGNISVAQAYISDISTPENRNKALGIIGAAFGLGFIIGPAVGGLLSTRFGYAAPAWAAAGLATINLLAVFFWLPESISPERRAELTHRPRPKFSVGALTSAMRRPRVGPLFHIRFFFGLAFSMFQSIFALYAAGYPLEPASARDVLGVGLRRPARRIRSGLCYRPAVQTLHRPPTDAFLCDCHDRRLCAVGLRAESLDAPDRADPALVRRRHTQHNNQQRTEQVRVS